jgi:hypothetical protein
MEHLKINSLTTDTLDRDMLEALIYSQRPKTKAARQKPIYYAMCVVGVFCQITSFVLASSGVLFLLVNNFKSTTGWVPILLAVFMLAIVEAFVWIMLKAYHNERLDDKRVNKSTLLLLGVSFCFSTPLTYLGTPYAVNLFASTPSYLEIDLLESEFNSMLDLESADIHEQIIGADIMAKDIHEKNSYKGKTSRKARAMEQAYITQKLKLENLLISKKEEINNNKSIAIQAAQEENETIKQAHNAFCASFGGWLSLVTIGAMVILFGATWYKESWKRLYVAEGKIKLKEVEQPKEERLDTKVKEPFRAKEVLKDIEKQAVTKIGFNPKEPVFNHKEGDVLKGKAPKVDRIFVLKDDGTLKAYTKGGLNNLIKGSSESRKEHLLTLKTKLG